MADKINYESMGLRSLLKLKKRKWDQELLQDLAKDITGFPFKSEFVEDVRQSKKMQEADPETWQKIESALTTKINERPYISFIDPLQGDNDE
jgi:hypothetical protein